jgi:hypothetical protein
MAKRYVVPADKVWQGKKPKYNGFKCGYGAHRSKKAYRRRPKHQRPISYEDGAGLMGLGIAVFLGCCILYAAFFF